MMLDLNTINNLLKNENISVVSFHSNSVGCEEYVRTKFELDEGDIVDTMIPYIYRRSNMDLSTEEQIADYLKSVKKYFTKEYIEQWVAEETNKINTNPSVKQSFLIVLLNKVCKQVIQSDFPENNNRQKILQTLKDEGYIIPILRGNKETDNETRYWLLPLPLVSEMQYEKIPTQLKSKIVEFLGSIDVYESRKSQHLLPDHKFSEIRWTSETAEINSVEMTEEEIRSKFQLLTAQRNQQKREVCRHCKKTGERGTIFGIKYFYEGSDRWESSIPVIGKDAEKGCVGCPWYDIQKWREELQKKLDSTPQ